MHDYEPPTVETYGSVEALTEIPPDDGYDNGNNGNGRGPP
jgi:hypothetical protein